MPNRPAIPKEIEREIMIECRHRCAVCGLPLPLERAHIIPWHVSREHRAEDLICLCANCHEIADTGKWGEETLREYKKHPWALLQYRNTSRNDIEIIESFRIRVLSWRKLQEICQEISQRQMISVSSRYQFNLYLNRDNIKLAFDKFLASNKVCFVLIGKSGVGKSNFVLSLCDEYKKEKSKISLLMFDGARLDATQSLTFTIGHSFDQYIKLDGGGTIPNIWEEIALIEGIKKRKVILLIDAINENNQGKELLTRIDELVADSTWPWLKIVITCRPEAWQIIKRRVRLAETKYYRALGEEKSQVELDQFSYSQEILPFTRDELPLAYEKYKSVFKIQTAYTELSLEVQKALRDPLFLRLVAITYEGIMLPKTISVNEIYDKYINGLVKTNLLRIEDVHFLSEELLPLLITDKHYEHVIPATTVNRVITKNGTPLFDLIHNDEFGANGYRINQSYLNLSDAGILIQRGEGLNYEITFRYERFYDYFGGRQLYNVFNEFPNPENKYVELAQNIQKYSYLWGVIGNALLFELKAGKAHLITSLCYTEEQAMKEIIVMVLSEYGIDKAKEIDSILMGLMNHGYLNRIRKTRKKQISKVLLRDKVRNAKKIAVEVSGVLGQESILLQAATDPDASIRAHAVKHIYYLWERDSSVELTSVDINRGMRVINNIVIYLRGKIGLPDRHAFETALATILLVFMNTHRKGNIPKELSDITRKGIVHLLYVSDNHLVELVASRIRRGVASFGIRLVLKWMGEAPKYNAANIHELSTFFDLPSEKKRGLLELLPYYDMAGNLDDIQENLMRAIELNDTITSWAIWEILILHGTKKPEQVRNIVKQLFNISISNIPYSYLTLKLVETLEAIARLNKDDTITYVLYEQLWSIRSDITKGRLHMKHNYITPSIAPYLICSDHHKGFKGTNLAHQAIEIAKVENDIEFLLAVIWELGFLGVSDRYYHLALKSLKFFIDFQDDIVHSAFINLLARIRQHHANAVDDFLEDNFADEELRRRIMGVEVKEDLGGDLMYMPAVELFAYGGLYPPLNHIIVWGLKQAVESQKPMEWVLNTGQAIISFVYGKDIFSFAKDYKMESLWIQN